MGEIWDKLCPKFAYSKRPICFEYSQRIEERVLLVGYKFDDATYVVTVSEQMWLEGFEDG